jgi:hypothetical protein
MKRAALIALLFAVTGLVMAQEQAQEQGGPSDGGASDGVENPAPGPGVAHISLIHGDVSMQRGDSGDWVATSLNTPIVSGDTVSTSQGSRAEVQLDYADVLRLSGQSQAKITDLARNHIQVQIGQGYVNMSMFQGGQAQIEIDTPNVAVHPTQNGRYTVVVRNQCDRARGRG